MAEWNHPLWAWSQLQYVYFLSALHSVDVIAFSIRRFRIIEAKVSIKSWLSFSISRVGSDEESVCIVQQIDVYSIRTERRRERFPQCSQRIRVIGTSSHYHSSSFLQLLFSSWSYWRKARDLPWKRLPLPWDSSPWTNACCWILARTFEGR